MEELSTVAMAYYQASSDHLQELARDFFGAMDNDGDGKIDQREFLEFMRDEGYAQMTNPSFFHQLDLDKNGTLDFVEVMTLYYIVKSGRPFCDNCKKFITSTYLTCIGCLEDPIGGSFYLCLDCYIQQKCEHAHDGVCRFLDNYSLLEAMTKSKSNELRSSEAKSRPMETNFNSIPTSNNQTWNPSLAMVPVPNRPPLDMAMVEVPYNRPPPIHNYHSWSQGGPSAPPVQNHTWIQNNYSYHYPPPAPLQHVGAPNNAIVPQRLRSLEAKYKPWSQGGPSSAPPIQNYTWIQTNNSYHHYPQPQPQPQPQPPPLQHVGAPNNAIVPHRERLKVAFGALSVALQSAVIGSTFCSIL